MDNDLDLSNLSDDEEHITAEAVLKTLQAAWLNEKFSPEILPHQNDMVECMLGQIQHMEDNINKLPKSDIRIEVHKMELNRIKYMISSYLRCRLQKIERYAIVILNDELKRIEDGSNYLTPQEYEYANKYLDSLKAYMGSAVLNDMPGNMQSFDLNKMAVYPNINSHVFLNVNETVNGVVLEGLSLDQDEEIDLEEGSQHILQYKSVAEFVKSGKLQLI